MAAVARRKRIIFFGQSNYTPPSRLNVGINEGKVSWPSEACLYMRYRVFKRQVATLVARYWVCRRILKVLEMFYGLGVSISTVALEIGYLVHSRVRRPLRFVFRVYRRQTKEIPMIYGVTSAMKSTAEENIS